MTLAAEVDAPGRGHSRRRLVVKLALEGVAAAVDTARLVFGEIVVGLVPAAQHIDLVS
jgi:hypothetical protein